MSVGGALLRGFLEEDNRRKTREYEEDQFKRKAWLDVLSQIAGSPNVSDEGKDFTISNILKLIGIKKPEEAMGIMSQVEQAIGKNRIPGSEKTTQTNLIPDENSIIDLTGQRQAQTPVQQTTFSKIFKSSDEMQSEALRRAEELAKVEANKAIAVNQAKPKYPQPFGVLPSSTPEGGGTGVTYDFETGKYITQPLPGVLSKEEAKARFGMKPSDTQEAAVKAAEIAEFRKANPEAPLPADLALWERKITQDFALKDEQINNIRSQIVDRQSDMADKRAKFHMVWQEAQLKIQKFNAEARKEALEEFSKGQNAYATWKGLEKQAGDLQALLDTQSAQIAATANRDAKNKFILEQQATAAKLADVMGKMTSAKLQFEAALNAGTIYNAGAGHYYNSQGSTGGGTSTVGSDEVANYRAAIAEMINSGRFKTSDFRGKTAQQVRQMYEAFKKGRTNSSPGPYMRGK